MTHVYEEGEIIWAKQSHWPWWPAQINCIHDDGKYVILFLGDNEVCELPYRALASWESKRPKKPPNGSSSNVIYNARDIAKYWAAVAEARAIVEGSETASDIAAMTCKICGRGDDESQMLLCEGGHSSQCLQACHCYCVGLPGVPDGVWFCHECTDTSLRPVAALVSRAITNVLGSYAWPPRPASSNVGDLVEIELMEHSFRPALIRDRRTTGRDTAGLFVQYIHPDPPAGVWRYLCKDSETLRTLVDALYPPDVAKAVKQIVISFQSHESSTLKDAAKLTLKTRLTFLSTVVLPEYHIAEENELVRHIATRYQREVEDVLKLNQQLRILPGASEFARLEGGTVVLLPPSMPKARRCVPKGPSNPALERQIDSPTHRAGMRTDLKAGSQIWLSTKVPALDDEGIVWRPATVKEVFIDD